MSSTTPGPDPRLATVGLRPMAAPDLPAVLAANEADVHLLAPLDAERLRRIQGWGGVVELIEVDGGFGGFVVTLGPGADYDSENYRWFARRHRDFCYLDRIVVAPAVRRRGVAGRVYDELEHRAAAAGVLALEVNADPPNRPSLRFHAARGYREVGRRGEPGHVVALMEKQLGERPRTCLPCTGRSA